MDSGRELALLEVYEQALDFATALAEQAAFETVEVAADDADLLAVELRGDFVEAVVFDVVGLSHGSAEFFHVGVSHCHDFEWLAAAHEAVLEQGQLADDGVEFGAGFVHEDEVGQIGNEAHHAPAELHEHALPERHEDTICHLGQLLQLLVGGTLGVGACQIAQHIPTIFHFDLDFFLKNFGQR